MKWRVTELGTKRKKNRFLFWPLKIGDEWRWLEKASWEEQYLTHHGSYGPFRMFGDQFSMTSKWKPLCWINKEKLNGRRN